MKGNSASSVREQRSFPPPRQPEPPCAGWAGRPSASAHHRRHRDAGGERGARHVCGSPDFSPGRQRHSRAEARATCLHGATGYSRSMGFAALSAILRGAGPGYVSRPVGCGELGEPHQVVSRCRRVLRLDGLRYAQRHPTRYLSPGYAPCSVGCGELGEPHQVVARCRRVLRVDGLCCAQHHPTGCLRLDYGMQKARHMAGLFGWIRGSVQLEQPLPNTRYSTRWISPWRSS